MKFSLQIVAVVICGLVQTSVSMGYDYPDDYDEPFYPGPGPDGDSNQFVSWLRSLVPTHYDPPPPTHYKEPEPHHKEPTPHHKPPPTHYKEPETHYKEPTPHHKPPPTHYKEPEPHHKPPPIHHKEHEPHYKEPTPHHKPPPTHYKEPEPHYGHTTEKPEPHYKEPHVKPEPHYEEPKPHHKPPPTHYKEPEPHHKPPPTHHKEHEPHYKEPTPHHEPPPSHYKEPEPHYGHTTEKPEPHYKEPHVKPEPHYEEPKPHHEPSPSHYKEPESHYKEPKPHHGPSPSHYKEPKPHYGHTTEKPLDPHGKGKQCVDVSTYTYPTWVKKDKTCCKTEFKKHIHKRVETVCTNVTSLYCDVWPYTECDMKMYDKKITISHWVYKFKPVYKCVKHYEDIVHKKKKPVCNKKPKQVCNSKWKIDQYGKKVWAGNEDCKTIYVDNCILETVHEKIKVEKPVCSVVDKVPFMTIEPKKVIKTVYKMECKVLKKNHCEAHTTKECKDIKYTESQEKPHKTCDPTYIKVPKQHLEHKKKCLFMAHDGLNHETYKLEH